MNRSVLLRSACAAAVVAAAGLAGCQAMGGSSGQQLFQASLSAAQEVPPAASGGNGSADLRYNPSTQMLSWSVTHSGLSGPVTAAHIHGPAPMGQNAGVAIPFTNIATSTITGEAKLTPQQLAQLVGGQMYVNLHTAANPNGEIRGQIRPK